MKKNILMLFSALLTVSLLGCSSNTQLESKTVTSNSIALTNVSSTNWADKTYVSIGDSISWQDKRKYPGTKIFSVGYQSLLDEKIGFKTIVNYSIVGASMAKSSNYPTKASIMGSFK